MKTHIVSSVFLLLIFVLALAADTNFYWIFGAVFILILMVARAYLGELTKKTEVMFIYLYIAAFIIVSVIIFIIIN